MQFASPASARVRYFVRATRRPSASFTPVTGFQKLPYNSVHLLDTNSLHSTYCAACVFTERARPLLRPSPQGGPQPLQHQQPGSHRVADPQRGAGHSPEAERGRCAAHCARRHGPAHILPGLQCHGSLVSQNRWIVIASEWHRFEFQSNGCTMCCVMLCTLKRLHTCYLVLNAAAVWKARIDAEGYFTLDRIVREIILLVERGRFVLRCLFREGHEFHLALCLGW